MRTSAGLLLYRWRAAGVELLLVHPGGPFWANKDEGAWSIPKGELDPGEDEHRAAIREFTEELGVPPPGSEADDLPLGTARQSAAKTVIVWARRGDFSAVTITSNVIEIEWPPRSGRRISIPEVDRADWCSLDLARSRLVKGQRIFVDRLVEAVGAAAS